MPQQRPFFVYGTLLPDQPNYMLWGDAILSEEPATLANGRLYDMGHYPMLVEEDGASVRGMLIAVQPEQYDTILTRLDDLEGYDPEDLPGSDYWRVVREVVSANGRSQQAWVYIGQAKYVNKPDAIPDGYWPDYIAAKLEQISQWWEDIKTVNGRHAK